jgi:hypothetical protein
MSSKINYLISFTFSKIIPICFLIYASQKFSNNDYVQIEIILAISLFFSTLLNFGMNGIFNITKKNNLILQIRSAHIQILSFLTLLLSIFFFFLGNYFLSIICSITSNNIILSSLINDLRLLKLKIKAILIEPLIYVVFVICAIINYFYPIFLFQILSSFIFIITSVVLLLINIKQCGFNFLINFRRNLLNFFNNFKNKKVLNIYFKSYNFLFFGIMLILLNIFPRIFINFINPNEIFDYLLGFRICFFSFFIHQIFSNFFHYELFKDIIKRFFLISFLSIFSTFIFSLVFIVLYFYIIEIELINLKNFIFNKLIIIQILFLSILGYSNIFILRSKHLINCKKIFFYLIIFFYILTYLLLKFYSNNLNVLIILHLNMILCYFLIILFKKNNKKI